MAFDTVNKVAIHVTNVKKYFKDIKAVNGVDITINKGEYLALLGPNGAGKTTLVEMIEGIQKPDSGEITINGKSWKDSSYYLQKILGISLQETHFMEKIRVIEILNLFASFYHLQNGRIDEILQLINLKEKRNAFIENLSGGQRQRLALGIALLNNPEILLLDEPTTGLDPSARREIWEILFRLKKSFNTTMILTTHYMEEADFLCDRIIILDKGKILAQGTLTELLSANKSNEIIEFRFNENPLSFDLPGNAKESLIWDEKEQKWRIMIAEIVSYLPQFMQSVQNQNLSLKSLECRKMTLDDLFISMTGRGLTD
jgi:ABC-2 type transport system ATP-binding protein